MTKNVYNSIYNKLKTIGIINEGGVMEHQYYKYKSEGLMDLSVDKLYKNTIALAHNDILNGDIMADPDIQIRIYPEREEAEGYTFQNDYLGTYQDVYDNDKCNEKLKKEINIFLDEWLSNIINCEYILVETED